MSHNNKEDKNSKNSREKTRVVSIKDADQYESLKDKGLVIIDFNTTWCGPCKRFAPIFDEMSKKYPHVTFLSVDSEKIEHPDTEKILSVPTFKVVLNGEVQKEFSGVNAERLEEYIERYQTYQIQISINGNKMKSFTSDDRKRIISYMDKLSE